jgi:hypothetical protein
MTALRFRRAIPMKSHFVFVVLIALASAVPSPPATARAQADATSRPLLMPLGPAWAANSVNTTIFRNDPVTSHRDRQYAAYYDADGRVVIATRTIGEKQWRTTRTELSGNVTDAHNVISIIADGVGFLHLSWDHHDHPLRYVRSTAPGSLELTEKLPMTGRNEDRVSYPQFFRLPDGNLVFFYRDGASGRGNLALNHYDAKRQRWTQLHENLLSGEGRRSAYPQACVDATGGIHVSWVWRETPDVATNHDLCYARSADGGRTWTKSDATPYQLPITAASAEIASAIPQKHELINQTSMCADDAGSPVIATYFRPPGERVPQYFIVHRDGGDGTWRTQQVTRRQTPFTLSGGGTKPIPISRPQVLARRRADGQTSVAMIFRDAERGSRVSISTCADLTKPDWQVQDLTDFPVGFWEPSYDHARWQRDGVLDLFVQASGQGDSETLQAVKPQTAYVLELTPPGF